MFSRTNHDVDRRPHPLVELPKGEGFTFSYSSATLDRNALRVVKQEFDPVKVSAVRTKYHHARLSFEDLKSELMEYGCKKAGRLLTDAYYMVLQSVVEDLKPTQPIIPISKKAVTQHQNFPGSKSAGLPYKQRGLTTKKQAIEEPGVFEEISDLW